MPSPTRRLARRERLRSARRYAPFAALAAGVGVAVAVLGADGGNGGNVDRDGADTSPVEVDSEELVRSDR
jgi:hypothetical protein